MQSSTHPERSLDRIPLLHVRNKASPRRLYWSRIPFEPKEFIHRLRDYRGVLHSAPRPPAMRGPSVDTCNMHTHQVYQHRGRT